MEGSQPWVPPPCRAPAPASLSLSLSLVAPPPLPRSDDITLSGCQALTYISPALPSGRHSKHPLLSPRGGKGPLTIFVERWCQAHGQMALPPAAPGHRPPSLRGRARSGLAGAGGPAVPTIVRLPRPQPGPAGGQEGVMSACQSPLGRSRAQSPRTGVVWDGPPPEVRPGPTCRLLSSPGLVRDSLI